MRRNWLVILLLVLLVAGSHFDGVRRDHARKNDAHKTCAAISVNRAELNRRITALRSLRDGVQIFVTETRRARANKHGSSYDPHFVKKIDNQVQPRLDAVSPHALPLPDCSGGGSASITPGHPLTASDGGY